MIVNISAQMPQFVSTVNKNVRNKQSNQTKNNPQQKLSPNNQNRHYKQKNSGAK
jgi:hypothetical protein